MRPTTKYHLSPPNSSGGPQLICIIMLTQIAQGDPTDINFTKNNKTSPLGLHRKTISGSSSSLADRGWNSESDADERVRSVARDRNSTAAALCPGTYSGSVSG